jgi:tRNA dimethylallyltransferase
LNIGTAKPGQAELAAVPHHLIDILDMGEAFEIFSYVELADKAVSTIRARNRLPILVGGSGLYIRAFLYGLDSLPADRNLRSELDTAYASVEGFEKLKELMQQKDPADYDRWHMHHRKLIRALEVFELTGKSITELQTVSSEKLRVNAIVWKLSWDRDELKTRIRQRTLKMFENGWIDETRQALACGILGTPNARQAIGYNIIAEHLAGKIDYETMIEKIVTATWHLAKKQMTWFNGKHPEAQEIKMPCDYSTLKEKLQNLFHDSVEK